MTKKLILLLVLVVMIMLMFVSMTAVSADETPEVDVSTLTPFTQGVNYMSLPGYYRYKVFEFRQEWISRLRCVRAVKAQGADPTIDCHTAKILNGCIEK
ncbi:hypothetical protein A2V71_04705 [Candidatus Berkelbacteria bacterium RBG_13_40_8]|uniref:Uncharacterized protein n=1 Tax=Candidatus Berkelbacteria bacterium RBG_13_40_8 TaxID=1797467 RepID=A0A1F5DMW2_9BACT|nr:MAG: hypothetical protein A2V71_04705 [Candidatus Berkelbacteria bacterium RBG_13_40_8]